MIFCFLSRLLVQVRSARSRDNREDFETMTRIDDSHAFFIIITMAKGRQGLYLEAWKFSVYLAVPILASVYYSDPDNQRYWADYW